MLTEAQHEALNKWYSRPEVLQQVQRLFKAGAYEAVEELLHKKALMPLGLPANLPPYMIDEDGQPLFPTALNPMVDQEIWQDAIEVGWEVTERDLGISHDDVHRGVAQEQNDEWQRFLDSVNQRKRERS